MPTTDNDLRREAIRRTLAQRAGNTPDALAVAESTLNTWHQMAALLTPVIGARGVDALFSRSLHLTSITFPWLAITGNHGNSTTPASFRACLEAHETAAAAEASNVLLVTFTELLATLIGESLTDRLLSPVWAPLPTMPDSDQEITP